MARYYLGIDNGGTNTKASVYSIDGKEVATASRSTKVFSSRPGFAEIDMEEMGATIFSVVGEAVAKSGIPADAIAGVSICGHGKGLYLVDGGGAPCRAGILSGDNRAWEYPLEWARRGVADKVYEKTCQAIMAPQAVCLLSWLKDHESGSLENVRWVFECKDYVRFLLTGEARAELTDYSGANLVNLHTRQYDRDLLALFGLEEFYDKLPPLVSSTDFCGALTGEAAARTGLKAGTPVFGGMFDIDACAIAAGVADESRICMIAGTWSINEFISRTIVGGRKVAMNSIFCDPGYYLAEESSPTSAVNLEWAVKTLLPEFKENCAKEGRRFYDELDRSVAAIPPGDSYPIYFPFIMASNAHPNAQASLIGLRYCQSRGHLMKSIYEGVAFSHRWHLERLLKGKTTPTPAIRLAGGVANSEPWVQMFADVTHLPVEVVNVKETGTLGAAMAVAIALGDAADYAEAASRMVRIGRTFQPDPAREAFYDRRYAMYKKLLEALDPLWGPMKDL